MARLRIKICCIANLTEAHLAIDSGADAIGLVARMPSGPGVIPEERIAAIAARVPPEVETFLLTSHRDAEAIVAQHRRCGTDTLQLCDAIPLAAYPELRAALPETALIQVIHVGGEDPLSAAVRVAPHVDGLLLDSGDPAGLVRRLGGTGRVHDWDLSRRICAAVNVPVFLAGGLTAENVADAVRAVGPRGVDVCTGVRSDDRLDREKLVAFCAAARKAAG